MALLSPLLAPFFQILAYYFEAPATQPTYNGDRNLKPKWTAPLLSLLIFLSIKRALSDFHASLRDFVRCTIPENEENDVFVIYEWNKRVCFVGSRFLSSRGPDYLTAWNRLRRLKTHFRYR